VRETPGQLDAAEIAAHVPQPRPERGAWAAAVGVGALGLAVLALALSGALGGSSPGEGAPPPVLAVAPTPATAASAAAPAGVTTGGAMAGSATGTGRRAIVGDPSAAQARRDLAVYLDPTSTHISERWMAGFYPIYATAQRAFGVNWLLIASIHRQESAFSTSPGIYNGLNFAGCCGGPMQFNVTNRPVTTWSQVSDSYRDGVRPAKYDHMTARHPSIYDDFDSIMAAAHLLSADGAGPSLDGLAWNAAYDYYGHDATGITYADQVLARAIAWSQHGFCINCGTPQQMVEAQAATSDRRSTGSPIGQRAATRRRRPPARAARPPRGR
jgi:hypothetical protein